MENVTARSARGGYGGQAGLTGIEGTPGIEHHHGKQERMYEHKDATWENLHQL
jgi:hypothetical protein